MRNIFPVSLILGIPMLLNYDVLTQEYYESIGKLNINFEKSTLNICKIEKKFEIFKKILCS